MGTAHTKSVTVRLDVELNDRLDRYCEKAELSKSLVVNCALAHFLNNGDRAKLDVVRDYVVRVKHKDLK